MGRSKKTKYRCKSFESKGEHYINSKGRYVADTSANIYESMLDSPAFKSMNKSQQLLYVYCKAQYYGKRKPSKDHKDLEQEQDIFYFNWGKALEYGLYTPTSSRNFYRDLKVLVEHGFIKRIYSGQGHKEKNVYQFASGWQKWGDVVSGE